MDKSPNDDADEYDLLEQRVAIKPVIEFNNFCRSRPLFKAMLIGRGKQHSACKVRSADQGTKISPEEYIYASVQQ